MHDYPYLIAPIPIQSDHNTITKAPKPRQQQNLAHFVCTKRLIEPHVWVERFFSWDLGIPSVHAYFQAPRVFKKSSWRTPEGRIAGPWESLGYPGSPFLGGPSPSTFKAHQVFKNNSWRTLGVKWQVLGSSWASLDPLFLADPALSHPQNNSSV